MIGPPDADKYFNRGLVKAELGEFVSAIDDYSKAIELDKTDAANPVFTASRVTLRPAAGTCTTCED